jgi:hypothetical protein
MTNLGRFYANPSKASAEFPRFYQNEVGLYVYSIRPFLRKRRCSDITNVRAPSEPLLSHSSTISTAYC